MPIRDAARDGAMRDATAPRVFAAPLFLSRAAALTREEARRSLDDIHICPSTAVTHTGVQFIR